MKYISKGIVISLLYLNVAAECCRTPFQGPLLGSQELLSDKLPIEINADRSQVEEQGLSVLEGNVVIQQGAQTLETERAHYHTEERRLSIQQGFHYKTAGLSVKGQEAEANLADKTLGASTLNYRIDQLHATGTANQLNIDSQEVLTFEGATYTTCKPESNAWEFKADHLILNPKTGWGLSKGSLLKVKDVPVFYFPYFKFPIDKRRHTGFLPPTFGHSEKSGTEVSLPFYWNIAPNYDATIAPRYLSERGEQLQTEFRYLTQKSEGQVNVEWLPGDDKKEDEDRSLIKLQNDTTFNSHWGFKLDAIRVSDKDYFEDLGDNLSLASLSHLQQEASLFYKSDAIGFSVREQGFQTIDRDVADVNRPFERLPQGLLTTYHPLKNGLVFSSHSEIVYFERDISTAETDNAFRASIQPKISLPFKNTYGSLTPALSYLYTYYDLESDTIDRSVPIASIDGRLLLERETKFFSKNYLQTLEPRLFYLYIPERSQNDIPAFDGAEATFNYFQLFRENRFTGLDRIGDDHHVSLALSSRFMDRDSGEQPLKVSVGQIFFLRDRNTMLRTTDEKVEQHTSPVVGEIDLKLAKSWSLKAATQWDYEEDKVPRHLAGFHYESPAQLIFNLVYQFRDSQQNQIDGSVAWPINDAWRLFGRYYYDFKQGHLLEYFYGAEYHSCCWGIRAFTRRQIERRDEIDETDQNYDQSFWVQLELKGLTGIGKKAGRLLESSIAGFRDDLDQQHLIGL